MDDIIKRLDRIEELLDFLLAKSPVRLPLISQMGCSHPRMVPSHLVISSPMTFTCPDCGETVTIGPNVIY